jgi:hypothetical protein
VPEQHIVIDKFDTVMKVNKSKALPQRMIAIRGNYGNLWYFFVQNCSRFPKVSVFQPLISPGISFFLFLNLIELDSDKIDHI